MFSMITAWKIFCWSNIPSSNFWYRVFVDLSTCQGQENQYCEDEYQLSDCWHCYKTQKFCNLLQSKVQQSSVSFVISLYPILFKPIPTLSSTPMISKNFPSTPTNEFMSLSENSQHFLHDFTIEDLKAMNSPQISVSIQLSLLNPHIYDMFDTSKLSVNRIILTRHMRISILNFIEEQ